MIIIIIIISCCFYLPESQIATGDHVDCKHWYRGEGLECSEIQRWVDHKLVNSLLDSILIGFSIIININHPFGVPPFMEPPTSRSPRYIQIIRGLAWLVSILDVKAIELKWMYRTYILCGPVLGYLKCTKSMKVLNILHLPSGYLT